MGCDQSRESKPGPPFFSSGAYVHPDISDDQDDNRNQSQDQDQESSPLMSSMSSSSSKPTYPPQGIRLASQHERLIMELLPFKKPEQFHEWIGGRFVRGSWHEYCRDFLARNPSSPEPDKDKTANAAKKAVNDREAKYVMYHPEKDSWTPEDHAVRFIATVVSDNMLKGIWSTSDWKRKDNEITKAVYEVLSFLRQTEFAPRTPSNLPGYSEAIL